MRGGIVIDVECSCGHRAVLAAEVLGEDPATFSAFNRLRCTVCGRRGRPVSVTRAWRSGVDFHPYRGSYPRA